MVRNQLRPSVIALVALALLAGACGSGRSSSDDGSGGTDDTAAATTAAAGTWGDLSDVCGPGDASGATDQGVTDDSITIGYGDDAGYTGNPGTNHEVSLTIEAMMDWCNAAGGGNGRTVKGNYYDAAIFNANNAMTDACGQVFMMVGQAFSLDGSAEQTRVSCGLPAVNTWAVEGPVANGPDMFVPLPAPVDIYTNIAPLAVGKAYPDEVKKAAIAYIDFATGVEQRDKTRAAASTNGWEFVDCDISFAPTGVPDFKPYMQKLKDCGVETVFFIGAVTQFRSAIEAAAQIEYRPLLVSDASEYNPDTAIWNEGGYAGSNLYVSTQFVPKEQAESNAAVAQYLDVIGSKDIRTTQLSEMATSAFLLWASVATKCGADLTRECMVSGLQQVTSWTAGGMHAATNPGENQPGECGLTLNLDGSTWKQWDPSTEGEFNCDPDNFVTVDTPAVADADLGPDRISQKYTQ